MSGLVFENLTESLVKNRLKKEYCYRFEDKNGVDFAIYEKWPGKQNGTMIAGIQCKASLDAYARALLSTGTMPPMF